MTTREPLPYPESCPYCEEAIARGQFYCGGCGNEISPEGVPSCPKCLTAVWKSDRFCRQCGVPMCVCGAGAGDGRRS